MKQLPLQSVATGDVYPKTLPSSSRLDFQNILAMVFKEEKWRILVRCIEWRGRLGVKGA